MGLFRWITEKLTGIKKDEITNLRQRVKAEIVKTCQAAKKGDTDAALKMKALEEGITEQSIRLTGKPKPPSTVILPPDAIQPH